ncbi:hypothetical protein IG197_09005 [Aminobacter sp. SR38]|uniref:hypothetical protein n=1 Tax=Aminobacter sp. SR38 TaxID=2774562 RepID=UPI00177C47E6|nr:hypothetical protein [Aminobacter sp. SR38]QOF73170.1 hypothetical protein IG197_09005 [Aminobacter sp. SR38]
MNEEYLQAAVRAARRRLERLPDALGRLAMDASGNGAYGGSRFYSLTANAIRDHYSSACQDACGVIVRLAGQSSYDYADALDQALAVMAGEACEKFPVSGGAFHRRDASWLSRDVAELRLALQADRMGLIADLSLGLSEGVTMAKPTVSIDNRGGAAAVMVGDGNSQKIEGGIKASAGIDVAELQHVLAMARDEVARASLAIEHREEIEDAIVSTEREAQQDQPNPGRVKRLLNTAVRTLKERGVPMAEKVLEAYLKTIVT